METLIKVLVETRTGVFVETKIWNSGDLCGPCKFLSKNECVLFDSTVLGDIWGRPERCGLCLRAEVKK